MTNKYTGSINASPGIVLLSLESSEAEAGEDEVWSLVSEHQLVEEAKSRRTSGRPQGLTQSSGFEFWKAGVYTGCDPVV